MSKPEYHPTANLFPLLEGPDFDALVADIKANGLRESITLLDGKILDGRNRYRACLQVGVDPTFREFDGNGSPLAFVISLNLHRRHLDESQRSMVAGKLATMKQGARTDLASNEARLDQSEAAEMLNVSRSNVQRARQVLDHGTPEIIAAVDQGKIAVSLASGISNKDPEMQNKFVEMIVREKMQPTEAARQIELAERRARHEEARSLTGPAPEIDGRPIRVLKKPDEPRWSVELGPNAAGIALPQRLESLKTGESYVEQTRKISSMEAEAEKLERRAQTLKDEAREAGRLLQNDLVDKCQRIHGRAIPYTRSAEYEVTAELNEQLMKLNAEGVAEVLLSGPEQAIITAEGVASDCAYWFPDEKIPGKRALNCWMRMGNE